MKQVLTGILLMLALQGFPASLLAQAGDPAVTTATTTTAAEQQTADPIFTSEQLEQLVAPIALYPDALLMQILMASTYPLEVVEADRWISKQPDLKGDALDKALLDKDWDPSVKSLTTLPSVLTQMSDNLDWTQDLGDAFLAQENDLLDTVQIMRGKAYEAGNLQTTEQQQVTQNPDKIIVIQQASPEVVYVPTYSPTVVYGPAWHYPSYYYPSMYPYYPPGYGLLAFGVGVAVGGAIWGNCNWGWGHNNVNINVNQYNNFNRNTNNNFNGDRGGNNAGWKHDATHRKGVDYKSKDVAQRNGASAGSNRVTKDQARGRSTAGTTDRAGAGGQAQNRAGTGGQAQNRASGAGGGQAQNRATGAGGQAQNRAAGTGAQAQNRSAGSQVNRASSADRSQSAGSSAYKQSSSPGANRSGSSGGNSAFSGSRTPSSDRMSSSRGASSRGTSSYGGSRGGGGGGGGGSRGGGGRRH